MKKSKKSNNHNALLGAGLMAGGLGLYRTSKNILSDQEYNDFGTFKNFAQNDWSKGADPRESLKQYVEYGHRGAATTPFGLSVPKTMGALRSDKTLSGTSKVLNSLGLNSAASWVQNQKLPNDGVDHYAQAAKSPLDLYRKLSDEYTHGQHGLAEVAQNNLRQLNDSNSWGRPTNKKINEFLAKSKYYGDPALLNPDQMARAHGGINRLVDDTQPKHWWSPVGKVAPIPFAKGNTAMSGEYMKRLNRHINDLATSKGFSAETGSVDQKRQVYNELDNFIKGKDNRFWKQKQYADHSIGSLMPSAGATYGGLMGVPMGMRNFARYAGIGLGAAGVGIGGYALYKMLKGHLAKKKAVQAQSY